MAEATPDLHRDLHSILTTYGVHGGPHTRIMVIQNAYRHTHHPGVLQYPHGHQRALERPGLSRGVPPPVLLPVIHRLPLLLDPIHLSLPLRIRLVPREAGRC